MSNVNCQRAKVARKRVYLDYAATTPQDPRVEKAMRPVLRGAFGNPSSIHAEGVAAKKALDNARTTVARCLEAHAEEIVFTSGGTEANNLAIFGIVSPLLKGVPHSYAGRVVNNPRLGDSAPPLVRGTPHIVTTNIEHASVLEPLRRLEKEGRADVTYVPVEPHGIVKPEKIIAAVRLDTVLVSVMYPNH